MELQSLKYETAKIPAYLEEDPLEEEEELRHIYQKLLDHLPFLWPREHESQRCGYQIQTQASVKLAKDNEEVVFYSGHIPSSRCIYPNVLATSS